jgi:large subunit ribosomal protein L30e
VHGDAIGHPRETFKKALTFRQLGVFMKAEIRKLLGSDKLVIGSDRCIKLLRQGELKKIMIASNCRADLVEDVTYYSGLTGAELITLDVPNEELGVFCKKPFNISVLGIRA